MFIHTAREREPKRERLIKVASGNAERVLFQRCHWLFLFIVLCIVLVLAQCEQTIRVLPRFLFVLNNYILLFVGTECPVKCENVHCPKGIRTNVDGCFVASCECNHRGGEGTSGLYISFLTSGQYVRIHTSGLYVPFYTSGYVGCLFLVAQIKKLS